MRPTLTRNTVSRSVAAWFLLRLFLGLVAAKADRHLYKSLLYVPRYAFWKLTLYAKLMARGGPSRWVRTERDGGSK